MPTAIVRRSKPTLTPIELGHGDTLTFIRSDGTPWTMTLLRTAAEVTRRGALSYVCSHHPHGDILAYAVSCELRVNGRELRLRREIGGDGSFSEPWLIDGVHLWFDAASCAFHTGGGFLAEKDWRSGLVCTPARAARFAVQDAGSAICPEPVSPWYPGQPAHLDLADCYCGEDCWMGAYNGAAAHGGLDVNMPAGTVLTAPIAFDDHYLVNATAAGFANNRWRGVRSWPDGSQWWLQAHHLIDLLVPERGALARGTAYATTAGTAIGLREHTHFVFRVLDQGGDYLLDPWLVLAAARATGAAAAPA